ncbi:MAG: DNA replication/repair protein RecF [Wenzhouxiangellaceae bacterium]|nr:DNA replication/repair protein RecF [Wenzhouxiangellaceae bacterium]
MRLETLHLTDLRNIAQAELAVGAGMNWFYGANGAGKTSVLEAIHLLARGYSFRTRQAARLIRDGSSALRVLATTAEPGHRLGVERDREGWRGRIDGRDGKRVSEFASCLPLVLVEPENHQLIEGPPALRRSFLDWGLFHVEHDYLSVWRTYARALRQRNAGLRDGADTATLQAIEQIMAPAAARVDALRAGLVKTLQQRITALAASLGFALEPVRLEYAGADEPERHLEVWQDARAGDREQGHTRHGPQRAHLSVRSGDRAAAHRLSRGQMKLAALLLRLALLGEMHDRGIGAMLLLDDPVSELDGDHLSRLLAWLADWRGQVWVTAVDQPDVEKSADLQLFHVEQGKIRPVV